MVCTYLSEVIVLPFALLNEVGELCGEELCRHLGSNSGIKPFDIVAGLRLQSVTGRESLLGHMIVNSCPSMIKGRLRRF